MNDSSKESYTKYKVCVVCNVPQSEAPGVIYAKFPKNINRCRQWIRMIGDVQLLQLSLKKIQNRYVCGNHFVQSDFTRSHKHLRKNAVPTIVMSSAKPLTKDAVMLFPPLVTRTSNKVTLKCTQRIVPIKRETAVVTPDPPDSPESNLSNKFDSTDYEYLDEEYIEPYEDSAVTRITVKQEALDPSLRDCVSNIIPILHHNLPPNSQTTEIYTINKDRQVIPITTKVLSDGKDCIIELSQKKIPLPKEPKVIPVSNEVLSSILKKDCDVTVECIGYRSDAVRIVAPTSPKKPLETQRESELQTKIQRLQRRNKQLKRMLKKVGIIDEITSPHIKKVIQKAILNKQMNMGINEFTKERQLAISILKRALNAYHYLSCLVPLPNVCTLQKISMKDPVYSNTTKCKHLL